MNTGDTTPSLRMLCPAQQTVRQSFIDSIVHKYPILQTTLEEIQQGHDEYSAKASGLLACTVQYDTFST